MNKKTYRPEDYDSVAIATGWNGPSVVFGLMSEYIRVGQTLIDIGIGTGLGSEPFFNAGLTITGMDISDAMLDICRKKKIAAHLIQHDMMIIPYPFPDGSFDHAISTGVFHFYPDLGLILREISRIITGGGMFSFVAGDHYHGIPAEIPIGGDQPCMDGNLKIYLHDPRDISGWLEKNRFELVDSEGFIIWMDETRSRWYPARAFLAEKVSG